MDADSGQVLDLKVDKRENDREKTEGGSKYGDRCRRAVSTPNLEMDWLQTKSMIVTFLKIIHKTVFVYQ